MFFIFFQWVLDSSFHFVRWTMIKISKSTKNVFIGLGMKMKLMHKNWPKVQTFAIYILISSYEILIKVIPWYLDWTEALIWFHIINSWERTARISVQQTFLNCLTPPEMGHSHYIPSFLTFFWVSACHNHQFCTSKKNLLQLNKTLKCP